MKTNQYSLWLVILFVAAAGIIRVSFSFFPALANISVVAAMALFGGYYFQDKRIAFSLPLLIMFLSDVALEVIYKLGLREYPGFHPAMPFVYAGFLAPVAIGALMKNAKPLTLLGGGLLASVVFFVISNFGVWMTGHYPKTWEGLIACYALAIPFFQKTFVGDLISIGVFFGSFEWLTSRFSKPATA